MKTLSQMTKLSLVALMLVALVAVGSAEAAGFVFDNTTNTVTPKTTYSSGLAVTGGSLSANGDIILSGTDFQVRENSTNSGLGLLAVAKTWTAVQTHSAGVTMNAGALFGTFSPAVNGTVGYDGTTFLFREAGTNKVFASLNTANTYTALPTFNSGIKLGSFTPTFAGEVGFDGTDYLIYKSAASHKIAAFTIAQTWTALQSYNAGIQVNSFTPTVNGQVGWSGTEFLFREGGTNRTLSSSTFAGDLAGNDLRDATSTRPVTIRDIHGTSFGNAATEHTLLRGVYRATTDATATELTLDGTAPAAGTRLLVASGSMSAYRLRIAARCTGGAGGNSGQTALYLFDVVAKNSAGTTTLQGDFMKTIVAEGVAGWDVTVAADDTNDSLQVNVTGGATDNISWEATVEEISI